MESEDLQSGLGEPRESENLKYVPDTQKIDVEIREIVRIKPQDFSALKLSFEEWARQWD